MNLIGEYLNRNKPEKILRSGFVEMDNILSCFDKSNLYVLAGRPGMGKTAFGLTLVYELAIAQEANIGIISYEMKDYQIATRLLAISSNIPSKKILHNDLEEYEKTILEVREDDFKEANIMIHCPSNMDFKSLKNKIFEFKTNNNIDFLMIDDIQRITISEMDRRYAANREQEVSKNVRELKSLAKEFDIPVFAISQLNRDNKDRIENKHKPILTDIRDSGAIENDSDVVILLHRPEYYGIMQDAKGNSTEGLAEFEIAKNRHGETGSFSLHFDKEIPGFSNIDHPHSTEEPSTSKMNYNNDEMNIFNYGTLLVSDSILTY